MRYLPHIVCIVFFSIFSYLLLRASHPIEDLTNDPEGKDITSLCDFSDLSLWKFTPMPNNLSLDLADNSKTHLNMKFATVEQAILISCLDKIELYELNGSKTINIILSSDQDSNLHVGLHRSDGKGPLFGPFYIEGQTDRQKISIPLEDEYSSKLNWLVDTYREVLFFIDDFERGKPLNILLYEVYLE